MNSEQVMQIAGRTLNQGNTFAKLTTCTDGELEHFARTVSAEENKILVSAITLLESYAIDMGDAYEIRSDIFEQAMSIAGIKCNE